MLIHLFITLCAIAAYFTYGALTKENRVLSFLSALLWFILGISVYILEFVWINAAGTVITHTWDTAGAVSYLFWGMGLIMLVTGFFQVMGYTAVSLKDGLRGG